MKVKGLVGLTQRQVLVFEAVGMRRRESASSAIEQLLAGVADQLLEEAGVLETDSSPTACDKLLRLMERERWAD